MRTMISGAKLALATTLIAGALIGAAPSQAGDFTVEFKFGNGGIFHGDDDHCLSKKQSARLIRKNGYDDPHYVGPGIGKEGLFQFYAWKDKDMWSVTIDPCERSFYEEVPAS